jgi:hypothetical protein
LRESFEVVGLKDLIVMNTSCRTVGREDPRAQSPLRREAGPLANADRQLGATAPPNAFLS